MPEFLTVVLAVIFCIVVLAGCISAIITFILFLNFSSFLLKLADAVNNLRQALIEGLGTLQEGQKAVAEANVKISNENAQVLMDTMVITAQMLEIALKGMGYSPKIEGGLKDITEDNSSNYNRPPVPKDEEGLSYTKK